MCTCADVHTYVAVVIVSVDQRSVLYCVVMPIYTTYTLQFPGSLQSDTKEYAVHEAFSRAPFQMNGLSGDLVLERSLLVEGTLPRYDIVIVAGQGRHEAWTLTTIIISEMMMILFILIMHAYICIIIMYPVEPLYNGHSELRKPL